MKKTITICASAAFNRHVNELADTLRSKKFQVLVPLTANKMRTSNDYDVNHYKTWHQNIDDFAKKTQLMRSHFDEVVKGDAILVVNDEKHGVPGYIGPNVLIEMGLAFYLGKPIFILNSVTHDMPLYEEVVAMGCVTLDGKLDKIKL